MFRNIYLQNYLPDSNWNRSKELLSDGIFAKNNNDNNQKPVEEQPKKRLNMDPWKYKKYKRVDEQIE